MLSRHVSFVCFFVCLVFSNSNANMKTPQERINLPEKIITSPNQHAWHAYPGGGGSSGNSSLIKSLGEDDTGDGADMIGAGVGEATGLLTGDLDDID